MINAHVSFGAAFRIRVQLTVHARLTMLAAVDTIATNVLIFSSCFLDESPGLVVYPLVDIGIVASCMVHELHLHSADLIDKIVIF